MFISRWKNALLDSLLLAICTVLTIPSLLMGISPLLILGCFLLISFPYYLLRKRERYEFISTLGIWPLFSIMFAFIFKNLVAIETFSFINLVFSVPGVVFYIVVVLSMVSAQYIYRKYPIFNEGFVAKGE